MVGRRTAAVARRAKAARMNGPRAATQGHAAAQFHSHGPSPGRVNRCQGRRDNSTSVRLSLDELLDLGPFLGTERRGLLVDTEGVVKVTFGLSGLAEFRAGAA